MSRAALLRWSFFALLLVLGGVYVAFNIEDFRPILRVRRDLLPLLLVPPLAAFFCLGLLNKLLVQSFGVAMSFREWYGLAVVTSLGNHFLPMRLGASARAIYLKALRGLPISSFLSTLGATYVINSLLAAAIASACLLAIGGTGDAALAWLALALALLALGLTSLLFVRVPDLLRWRRLRALIEGWEQLRRDRALMLRAALVLVANFVVLAVNLRLCFYALSIDCSPLAAMTIATLLGFTRLISISPANLGIQEGVTAALAELLGIGFDEGLMASVLARISLTFVTFTLGPLFASMLSGAVREARVDRNGAQGG